MLELLVAISVTAVLALFGLAAYSRMSSTGDQADSTARLRSLGQAVLLHAAEHDHYLPGPLWPGQVMLYDPAREGRVVRELAPYLGIEQRPEPYLVSHMIPRAYRKTAPGVPLHDLRVYVMNPGVTIDGRIVPPFGALTTSPPAAPLRTISLGSLPAQEQWMLAEADQKHPYVATAPWRASTPEIPVHGGRRGLMKFDGSIEFENVP